MQIKLNPNIKQTGASLFFPFRSHLSRILIQFRFLFFVNFVLVQFVQSLIFLKAI